MMIMIMIMVMCKRSILSLIMKANETNYFSNLFDKVLYMFRTIPLSIIRTISTLYTQAIGICHASSLGVC